MLRAIAAAKKKNNRIDANKIADALRCDFLPAVWKGVMAQMASHASGGVRRVCFLGSLGVSELRTSWICRSWLALPS
jgi:hypothetical protein